jgi:putative ABC transport system permease protein
MENLIRDLRYSLRVQRSKPLFTLIAVLTLGLGIGATTAIFSIVNAVIINPLPYKEPERLLQFWESNPLKNWTQNVIAPANLLDWQAQNQSFTEIAAYIGSDKKGPGLTGFQLNSGDEPVRLQGLYVTGNLFTVLGSNALLGRTLVEEETWQGKHEVLVLSYNLWQRQFAGDPNIIGQKVTLSGRTREVVGVMPQGFYFPSKDVELWAPMGWDRNQISQVRRPHFLRAIGRLKPGVTADQARSEMTQIAAGLEQKYPDTNTQRGVGVGPLKDWIVSDIEFSLIVLFAAVGFVLLIACINVANLLLARVATRSREVAIRSALGASRKRIIFQLLTESLLLAVLGAALGLILAVWGKDLLIAYSPGDIPRLDEIRLDWRVLSFTIVATFLTTLLTGLAPAIQSSNPQLSTTLKEGGQRGSAGQGNRLRNVLVIAEVALAIVLTIGAGLMIRSFLQLQKVDSGVDARNVLTFKVSLPGAIYRENSQQQAFFNQAEQRIRNLPGVEAVGSTTMLPLKGYLWTGDMTIEGWSPEDYVREVRHKEVTLDYFRAIGLPLQSGRNFNDSDNEKSQPVIVVNATFAKRIFPNDEAVGKRVKFGKPTVQGVWQTIIGVVGDEKQDGLNVEVKPEVYQSNLQSAQNEMAMVVRASSDPETLVGAVRQEIRALDRNLPLYEIKTMNEVIGDSLTRSRFITLLLFGFACLALILAAIGIYGVMAYGVTQRTQEIGIRMALGAGRGDVLKMVLWQGMKMTFSGVVIGLVTAFALSRLIANLLFGVSASDPITYVLVALILSLVALLACYMPARRATKTDPLVALRYE